LVPGSRIAVVGGGPAGSFFTYFLLELAQRAGLQVCVDVYEPRDFTAAGPAGCNMCGGIISESLVQTLAAEGIQLPATVVERGIDSYVLHTEEGRVRIDTPQPEKRIAAVHRGGGPRGAAPGWAWQSFDGYLLDLARSRGGTLVRQRVESIEFRSGLPHVLTRDAAGVKAGTPPASATEHWKPYDLVAVAVGIKSVAPPQLLDALRYRRPETTRAFNCELFLGQEQVSRWLGSSMHVFLLRLPRLKFGALIPKGEHVTLCLLGRDIDKTLVEEFLRNEEVRRCLPPDFAPPQVACHCAPKLSLGAGSPVFADRLVLIGDCGVTRLYKDGIGADYRTAKAAAVAVVYGGTSAEALQRHYWPACRAIQRDNAIGRALFSCSEQQKRRVAQRAMLRTVQREQRLPPSRRLMSSVLWDMFTGTAPYSDILRRLLDLRIWGQLLSDTAAATFAELTCPRTASSSPSEAVSTPAATANAARAGELGRTYQPGEVIVRQGEPGDCMYIIQDGRVEVSMEENGVEVQIAVLGPGELFGEMAICDGEVRSATVRAVGHVRALTVDGATFLRRVHQDPSLAMRVVRRLCRRVRIMNDARLALGSDAPHDYSWRAEEHAGS
jgi:flavin-dependent dehydrogenase